MLSYVLKYLDYLGFEEHGKYTKGYDFLENHVTAITFDFSYINAFYNHCFKSVISLDTNEKVELQLLISESQFQKISSYCLFDNFQNYFINNIKSVSQSLYESHIACKNCTVPECFPHDKCKWCENNWVDELMIEFDDTVRLFLRNQ